jgi:hypothetical protein
MGCTSLLIMIRDLRLSWVIAKDSIERAIRHNPVIAVLQDGIYLTIIFFTALMHRTLFVPHLAMKTRIESMNFLSFSLLP